MKINFKLLKETKTCYRFESREGDTLMTLYLKKAQVDTESIDPKAGITVTVEQCHE